MAGKKSPILFVSALFLLLNAIPSFILAQTDVKVLNLDDAIAAAMNNNKSVQLAKLDEHISEANYKQTDAVYLPQIGISYTALSTNNPLNAFGFKLEQKTITQADFNPELLNHPSGTPDFTTKIELRQPLINMDMSFQRRAAAKQMEVYALKTQRTKEYLTFETKKAYLQLQMAYEAKNVLEEAVQTIQLVYKFTSDHFQQGLVSKSDVLNVQVQVAAMQSNLEKAKSNIQNASDYLSVLMGVPAGTVYKITLNSDTPITDTVVSVPSSRSDFMAMQKAIEAKSLMIQSSKMSYLPKLNAFGSYQLNDSRMLGFGANAYLAGVQMSWDIFKGNSTKNSIVSQTWERNKLAVQLEQQKEQSNLEFVKTKRDISDARFEIEQYKIAIEQASEALRILQNRYSQGLVNTTEVMMASTQVSQQKLSLAQALFNQHLSEAYLQFLTSTNTQ
jgi:outer membrane protein TolC